MFSLKASFTLAIVSLWELAFILASVYKRNLFLTLSVFSVVLFLETKKITRIFNHVIKKIYFYYKATTRFINFHLLIILIYKLNIYRKYIKCYNNCQLIKNIIILLNKVKNRKIVEA